MFMLRPLPISRLTNSRRFPTPPLGFLVAKTVGKVPILATRKTKVMCGSTMLSTDDGLRLTPSAVKKLRIDIYCENFVLNIFEISCLLR